MVNFKDPNAFADPQDSEIVADAKKHVEPPVEYNYTEVRLDWECIARSLELTHVPALCAAFRVDDFYRGILFFTTWVLAPRRKSFSGPLKGMKTLLHSPHSGLSLSSLAVPACQWIGCPTITLFVDSLLT